MALQLIDTVTPDIGLKTVGDKINANYGEIQKSASQYCGFSGTGDAIVLTSQIGPIAALTTGMSVRFFATSTNATAGATIALDGLPPVTCKTITGVNLPAGYIRTDVETEGVFDGTNFVLDREIERLAVGSSSVVKYANGYAAGIAYTLSSTATIADASFNPAYPISLTTAVAESAVYSHTDNSAPANQNICLSVSTVPSVLFLHRVSDGARLAFSTLQRDVRIQFTGTWY